MNRAKIDKEKKNVKLLFQYFAHYGFQHGFWTLVDGLCCRLKIQKVYEHADKRRYEICKGYLRKQYGELLVKYRNTNLNVLTDKISAKYNIWVFWWQGEQKLPYPVDLCIQSIKKHAGEHTVIVITEHNYKEYVDIPEYIIQKFTDGIISITSFSDILRFELLYIYGGIWLDSTYYFTNKIQSEVYEKSFFSVSNPNGRKWVVTKDIWSISFMAMTQNHPIAAYMREAFRLYWKKENINIAYLLADCFMAIGYEDIPAFKKTIDAVAPNNTGVFDLLEPIRNEVCTQQEFERLMGDTYIHKLTYKEKYVAEVEGKKTYFGRLIRC